LANNKKVVYTFGRFQSPTIGHEKLINKVINHARSIGAEHKIYASKSHDNKDNPIPYNNKVKHLRSLFPHANIEDDPDAHTAFHIVRKLSDQGYKDVTMVVGSDRVQEFRNAIGKYIKSSKDKNFDPKKHYDFDKFDVVSAGERDTSSGVSGASGSKMRQFAKDNDFKSFAQNTPTKNIHVARRIFNDLRKNLREDTNLTEELNHKKFGPMLDSFVSFASDKLGLQSYPNIQYKSKDDESLTFAHYNPSQNILTISTKNRHPMDIFRSVAHELVHHKQNLDGRIKNVEKEGSTGSDIENEANAEAGKIMRWFAKANPSHFELTHVTEETNMNESLYDPSSHSAVFLAGGPGSGKDFVMKRTLHGHGMTEINSDNALEFLMDKHNLSKKMPDNERLQRDLVRGRAKNLTKEKQRLAMHNRQGLIINGTADDHEKISTIKKHLEDMGYKTMMVYVSTSDEVSKERNVARGHSGGRTVPENIRSEKWKKANELSNHYENMFGKNNFVRVDNSHDYHKAHPEIKRKIDSDHNNVYKKVAGFVRSPNNNSAVTDWRQKEMQKRGISNYKPPKAFAPLKEFINQNINNRFKEYIDKPSMREEGTDTVRELYAHMTPGQAANAYEEVNNKKRRYVKKLAKENLGNNGIGPTYGVVKSTIGLGGGYSIPLAESIENWKNNPKTIERFQKKYGDLAEHKIMETAKRLNESINNGNTGSVKTIRKLRESVKERKEMGLYSTGCSDEMGEDCTPNPIKKTLKKKSKTTKINK